MAKDDPASAAPRRLAAIFCADVAGYTRLMSADEAATLRLLASYREVTDRLIAQHGGRIANTAGDSILAEFPSAVDALQCALGIQDRLMALSEQVPEERRIRFRIGLHVGEVTVRGRDLLGDGVNIAARLQALAAPGSVCLSDTAHQFTHRAVPLPFEDLGPQRVKNLDAPVRAYLVQPPSQSHLASIPAVHRRIEVHLARRFHELCHRALLEITRTENLQVIEYATLASLDDSPGIDRQQLADRLGLDVRKAVHTLRRLEARGYVAREPISGSSRHVFRATAAGLDIRRRLRPPILAVLDRIVAPLSERERETLRDLLARIIQAHEGKARPEPGQQT